MPVGTATRIKDINNLHISPLQMAIAAASLSNNGIRPVPRIALAVDTPRQGWVVLPALGVSNKVFPADNSNNIVLQLAAQSHTYWEWTGTVHSNQEASTWYLAGTLPNWQGTPLALIVLIEGDNQTTAQSIGHQLMQASIKP
jgi:hypothetical protein